LVKPLFDLARKKVGGGGGRGLKTKSNDKKVVVHVFYTVLGHSLNHRLMGLANEIMHQFFVVRATEITRELVSITHHFKYVLF
jgi:hypothetical protein